MKPIFLLPILVIFDIVFVKYFLAVEFQNAHLEIVVLFIYIFLANLLIAALLTKIKLGQYSGIFVLNAFISTMIMYFYTI